MKRTHTPILTILMIGFLALPSCKEEVAYSGPDPDIYLIPRPLETAFTGGTFSSTSISISAPPELQFESAFLQSLLPTKTQARVFQAAYGDKTAAVSLEIRSSVKGDEAYVLEITPEQIQITASTTIGVFYGIQTLRQLIPQAKGSKPRALTLPCLKITDSPRFPYRGMHLDVSRHFFGPEVVKRYLDVMSRYKLNTFHWHLTDDQGWRIQIDAYPKLNSIASWRDQTLVGHHNSQPWKFDGKRSGGFYSKDEIRDIVSYAAQRHITVVPEIEMPGHSQAILAAYPEFGCTGEQVRVRQVWGVSEHVLCPKEETFEFLNAVLDEVIELFPGKYIHIGGDECPKAQWEQSSYCQDLMRTEGLADEMELQSWIIRRIDAHLNSRGKTLIGWDEILEGGLAPNAVVMSWRGMEGGLEAAEQGHDVIMTPTSHVYLDYYQSLSPNEPLAIGGYLPIRTVYGFEPVPSALAPEHHKHILGTQGNVWTEYISAPLHLDYMAWPRGIALAEVGWSSKAGRNFQDFAHRLEYHLDLLRGDGIYAANHLYDLDYYTKVENGELYVGFNKIIADNVVIYSVDAGETWIPTDSRVKIDSSLTLEARLETRKGVTEQPLILKFNKHLAAGKPITVASDPQPQYNDGGIQSLVNGIQGSHSRYGDHEWKGFSGDDMEATIDLGELKSLQKVEIRFYQAPGQWIYLPRRVTVLTSEDGSDFRTAGELRATEERGEAGPITYHLAVANGTTGRYLRIMAENFGEIPAGEQGAGHNAWLFVDELIVQ
jgi:hexosaminidase